ncbi:MAG TPA: winged helix-turn-helix domain-containing protein, partial [Reyranella sp.]|nr:winged helix-turn-helix domain-containing protein [Reyranella sp.]
MITVNALSEVAALMGDPTRAAMLSLLMDGRAHTASELAHTAGITAQTASGHLGRMVDGSLLAARAQGR